LATRRWARTTVERAHDLEGLEVVLGTCVPYFLAS
jgi:hypothetical protein